MDFNGTELPISISIKTNNISKIFITLALLNATHLNLLPFIGPSCLMRFGQPLPIGPAG
jgi:hypothetical protein